jgi:hypothetical protein
VPCLHSAATGPYSEPGSSNPPPIPLRSTSISHNQSFDLRKLVCILVYAMQWRIRPAPRITATTCQAAWTTHVKRHTHTHTHTLLHLILHNPRMILTVTVTRIQPLFINKYTGETLQVNLTRTQDDGAVVPKRAAAWDNKESCTTLNI